MIHYTVRCENGHAFDGWFASSNAFDDQVARGLVTCPSCNSATVERGMMAPAVQSARKADVRAAAAAAEASAPATGNAPTGGGANAGAPTAKGVPSVPKPADVALVDERTHKLRALISAMHEAVKANGVDVGTRFAEEARRIHYGEAEARGIYGQADIDEARALIDEGIDILPLPMLPDDQN